MCSNKFLFTFVFFAVAFVYIGCFFPQHETLKVQLAMEHLAVIARQHHRSRQTAGFMISTALPVFCRCILQNPDALAIDRTEKTLNRTLVSNMYLLVFQHLPTCVTNIYVCKFSMFFSIEFQISTCCQYTNGFGLNQGLDVDGKRFWGQGDLFSRRRTVRDLLLLTYHDAAAEILFHSE